jgi:hypothetical protein
LCEAFYFQRGRASSWFYFFGDSNIVIFSPRSLISSRPPTQHSCRVSRTSPTLRAPTTPSSFEHRHYASAKMASTDLSSLEKGPPPKHEEQFPMTNWVYDVFLWTLTILVDLFFREVHPRGSWKVPRRGPVIFVAAPHANQVCRVLFPIFEYGEEEILWAWQSW